MPLLDVRPICNLGKAMLESIFIISLYMNPTSKSSDNSWEKILAPVPVTSDGKPISIHPAPPGWKPGHGPPPAPPSSPGHDGGSGGAAAPPSSNSTSSGGGDPRGSSGGAGGV